MQKFALVLLSLFLVSNIGAWLLGEDNRSIPSTGGQNFDRRMELAVPAFAQDDPRWSETHLGLSSDTLGVEGCAVTSGAMLLAYYGVKTDPQALNTFLTRNGGLDDNGFIDWKSVSLIAPKQLKLVYDGVPSYKIIDANLLAGNPVIVVIPLPDGAYHFVVVVGKEGRDYLIRDPAGSPPRPVYPLRYLADRIWGLCVFHALMVE